MNIVGLVLGIVGLAMKDKKKGFSLGGVIANGILLLLTILFIIIAAVNS